MAAEIDRVIQTCIARGRSRFLGSMYFCSASCHAREGNSEKVLENIQKALDNGYVNFEQVFQDRNFEPLKDDKNLIRIIEQMGICQVERDEA